ncbi:MAG: hypothetical protein B7Y39_14135 [Bdellovibrio sp. 28-41-41]|nr:MAG: hypothetical protein B7Y39_14135 [Bdellovibrio sp. 28-41-41]
MLKLKPIILSILLILIVVSAHDILPDKANYILWRAIARIGIDVAMTPLTADMSLMMEPSEATSFYQRKISIVGTTKDSEQPFAWDSLGFYEIRLPILLFTEYAANEAGSLGFTNAICFQLKKLKPELISFRIDLKPPRETDLPLGLNKNWICKNEY